MAQASSWRFLDRKLEAYATDFPHGTKPKISQLGYSPAWLDLSRISVDLVGAASYSPRHLLFNCIFSTAVTHEPSFGVVAAPDMG